MMGALSNSHLLMDDLLAQTLFSLDDFCKKPEKKESCIVDIWATGKDGKPNIELVKQIILSNMSATDWLGVGATQRPVLRATFHDAKGNRGCADVAAQELVRDGFLIERVGPSGKTYRLRSSDYVEPTPLSISFEFDPKGSGPAPAKLVKPAKPSPVVSEIARLDEVEKAYARLDARILEFAADEISKADLGQKLRDVKDKEGIFRNYYRQRIQSLVDRKELLVIRDGRTTKYRVRRPDDIEPEPAPVEVVAEVVPEPAPPRQLAPVKPSNALAPINRFLEGRQEEFERIFKDNPDMSWFRSVIADVVEVRWLEFEGHEWITVRQAGEKLGLDERTITEHFREFPYELSVLSTKLIGDQLKAYKLQYPGSGPTPDLLNCSEQFSKSGVGVIGDQSAHERAPHFILISPAGFMWLASRSQTDVANAIMQSDWIAKAKLPSKIKEVVTNAMNFAKTPLGQQISPQDYVEVQPPIKLVFEGSGLSKERLTVDLRDPAKDHILRNVNPPVDRINGVLTSPKFELHPLIGCTGDFIWYKWDKKNPYKTANPIIYMVFADALRRGFHTDLVSIGIGSSKENPRVCKSHERIQAISNKCFGCYDVFVLELLEPKYKDKATLHKLESDLRTAFHPFWDSMIDEVVRREWNNSEPDNGQQMLYFA